MAAATVPVDAVAGESRRVGTGWKLLILAVVWLVLWYVLQGRWVLETGVPEAAQDWLQNLTSSIGDGRMTNPIFLYFFTPIAEALTSAYNGGVWVTEQLGPTGMTALATGVALVWAGWRMALLTAIGFLCF